MSFKAVSHRSGFTLIELLLVVSIIGSLSAVVIIAINPSRQFGQSEDARRKSSVNQLQKAMYQYLIDNGKFPGDNALPQGAANAVPICRASYAETGGCINVDTLIDPTKSYLPCMPRDGKETSVNHSGYAVYEQVGRAIVTALYLGQNTGGSACEDLPKKFAYWRLDEGTAGAQVKDEESSGYNGTPNGAGGAQNLPQPATDVPTTLFKNTRSIHLDGTDDYISVGTFNVTGNAITLAGWYKADTFGPTGNDPRIISKAIDWQSNNTYWLLSVNDTTPTTGLLRFRLDNTTPTERSIDQGATVTNVWTHIAGVYDGTTMRLYKDGVEVGNTAQTGNIRTGAHAVWIGANPPNVADRPFTGFIDDVRIYDKALTAAQVLSLAKGNP